MATNTLKFQWKKAEPIYLSLLQRYLYLKSGLILSRNFDGFKEILVQVNKAVLGLEKNNLKCKLVVSSTITYSDENLTFSIDG